MILMTDNSSSENYFPTDRKTQFGVPPRKIFFMRQTDSFTPSALFQAIAAPPIS
jgi:hypothetical protein